MHKKTAELQETSLRYFLEVARSGSLTAAAETLSVAPSAISRQIAHLEKTLDTLLFERRARGMTLNAAGELLAAHAQRQLQDADRVLTEIEGLRGLHQGRVHIVSTAGFASDFLPNTIAAFRKRYTGIEFQLTVCKQSDVSKRIREGNGDIGINLGFSPESGVRVQFRHPSSVLAITAPTHPLAQRRQLSVAEIVTYPLALPERNIDSTLRQLFDICCSRQSLQYQSVFSSNDLNALIGFAAAGGGISLCGELAIRERTAAHQLCAIPLRDREMNERFMEVQTMAGRMLPTACQEFLQYLKASATGSLTTIPENTTLPY
ncbi:LysR family transcriptional regulator [Curvibacter sp. CHRR-16]|uniref:LysR family transcriptional regulator n=1 Tax=Curvibacter sp. CHRR-16 TaxID=2835872 RepID=UPI001BDA34A2|nr:LysR family transcriptional regulator [Curvibacter sp. CHRR-16]MBT0569766.1 LysR family transcriptional regulator [Curvibacter sp. CHRR-16]